MRAILRAGANVRDEVSLAARSPLAGQISLGGTGCWNRYRAPPWPSMKRLLHVKSFVEARRTRVAAAEPGSLLFALGVGHVDRAGA